MNSSRRSRLLFLVGMTGAGKSTVGRRLADRLDRRFVDLDDLIAARTQSSVANLFAQYGEFHFRCCEAQVLRDIPRLHPEGAVVATGAGAPIHFGSMDFMLANGVTIFLDATVPELIGRLRHARAGRPLLAREDWESHLEEQSTRRRPIYNRAHASVTMDGLMISQVLDHLQQQLPQITGH